MVQQSNTIEIFCCYAHKDKDLLDELKTHLSPLQRQKTIHVWYDGDISAGTEWDQEIKQHLNNAEIILLLISSDFIASEYCYGTEMKRALERHKRREVRVIPVILRPLSSWEKVPPGDIHLGQLQALPKDAKPVTSWTNTDEAWKEVAKGIERVINELLRGSLMPQSTLASSSLASVSIQKGVDHTKPRIVQRLVLISLAGLVILALASGIAWFNSHRISPTGGIHTFPVGVVTEFLVPTPKSNPLGIIEGPDGNLWFTESNGDKIGRITPSGNITEFPIPTPGSKPFGITTGPHGNLWFTEIAGNKVGRITPSGSITEFPTPTSGSNPFEITTGPLGSLWFTEITGNKVGRITPSGSITEFPVPTSPSYPIGITAGPDGNLWFTEYNGDKIGCITPSGSITEFPIPTSQSTPYGITAGPDDNLWFTEEKGDKIGRITPSGNITEFSVPTPESNPLGIIEGPDDNLWFTEENGDKIGRITPNGNITEFPVPTSGSNPDGITVGPDDNLWFTELTGDKVGRIDATATVISANPDPHLSKGTLALYDSLSQSDNHWSNGVNSSSSGVC